MKYIYKFSTDTHDYFMSEDMKMVKVPNDAPGGRSDRVIAKLGVDAEDDLEVRDYFSMDI